MTKDEALRLALDALEGADEIDCDMRDAITAIKSALEAKDEPMAYINVEQRKLEWAKYMSWDTPTVVNLPKIPLYTTPPQRTWVGLTDAEFLKACQLAENGNYLVAFQRIQLWLKEKNT
jgi:hypothetical protein